MPLTLTDAQWQACHDANLAVAEAIGPFRAALLTNDAALINAAWYAKMVPGLQQLLSNMGDANANAGLTGEPPDVGIPPQPSLVLTPFPVAGVTVNGNDPVERDPGDDGVHVLGNTPDAALMPSDSYGLAVSSKAGVSGDVLVEGITIGMGSTCGVYVGVDSWGSDSLEPSHVAFRGVKFTDAGHPKGPGFYGKWAGYGHEADIDFEDTVAEVPFSQQHFWYDHGTGDSGLRTKRRATILACGAEGWKLRFPPRKGNYPTSGPLYQEMLDVFAPYAAQWGVDPLNLYNDKGPYNSGDDGVFWPGRSLDLHEDCVTRSWGVPHPYNGNTWGGGRVRQGGSGDSIARRCDYIGGLTHNADPSLLAIGIDNGARPGAIGGEFFCLNPLYLGLPAPYGHSTVGDGRNLFEDCLIYIPGVAGKSVPIMRLRDCELIEFRRCLVVSSYPTRVGLGRNLQVNFVECNGPEVDHLRDRLRDLYGVDPATVSGPTLNDETGPGGMLADGYSATWTGPGSYTPESV